VRCEALDVRIHFWLGENTTQVLPLLSFIKHFMLRDAFLLKSNCFFLFSVLSEFRAQ